MRILFAAAAVLVCCVGSVQGQSQLIVNGGFETFPATPPWVFTNGMAGAGVVNDPANADSGSMYLSLGNLSNHTNGVYQLFSIPTNAVRAVLTYRWRVRTDNAFLGDWFRATVISNNLAPLAVVNFLTLQNTSALYNQTAFDLSPYIGQNIGIDFRAFMDSSGTFTSFDIDNVSASWVTAGQLPLNDHFTNRTVMPDASFTTNANNTFATKEPSEPNHAGRNGGRSLWWSWTAPGNGTVTINTDGSSFDTVLAVYHGTVLWTNFVEVASNDDRSDDPISPLLTSRVKFVGIAGTTYEIAVDGLSGNCGPLVLNLSFQPDTKPPTVSFTSPAAGAKLTNSSVVVQGKAADDIGVDHVEFRLENSSGTNAYQTATGTNVWSATVTDLVPGLNTVRVRSLDTSSNISATVTRAFSYVVLSPLTLTTNGVGTLSPNLNGQMLAIGATFKVTAKPGTGQIFTGWTGDVTSPTAALTFVMQTNMALQANFIPNPFLPVVGVYQGLFYQTNEVSLPSSGFVSATLTSSGAFSAKVLLAGKSFGGSGVFSATGFYSNSVPRKGLSPLTIQLQLDFGTGVINGTITDGTWTAELTANRNVFSKTNPTPLAGKYTLLIPGDDDLGEESQGDSFGTVTVAPAGTVAFSGSLSDGTTKASQSATLSADGQWPFYLSVNAGKGLVIGWLTFTNESQSDIHGLVNWIKLAQVAKYYPEGFTNEIQTIGSSYVFTSGVPVLNFSTGQVWLAEGNLSQTFTNLISLSALSKVTNLSSNKLTLAITTSSGLFKGSVTDPASLRSIPINGVVLQKQNAGYGFFLGTNEGGKVAVQAQP